MITKSIGLGFSQMKTSHAEMQLQIIQLKEEMLIPQLKD
jgi:hypothetical protein